MKKLEKLLNEIREDRVKGGFNDITNSIIDDILCKEEEYRYRWMEEVVNYGCISGIVGHLIYTKDIINYYNMFSEDIDEYIYMLLKDGSIKEGDIKIIESFYNEEINKEEYFYVNDEGEYVYIEEEDVESVERESITFKVWTTYEGLICDILNELEYKNYREEYK